MPAEAPSRTSSLQELRGKEDAVSLAPEIFKRGMGTDSSVVARVRDMLAADGPPAGSRVLVAVSGRLASVVLVDILHLLAPEFRFSFVMGHLRARGNDEQEKATAVVKEIARTRNIPLLTKNLPATDASFDQSRRDALLEALRQESGATAIATGQTADDLILALLLNMLEMDDGAAGLRPPPWVVWPLRDASLDACRMYGETRRLRFRPTVDALLLDTPSQRLRTLALPFLLRHVAQDAAQRLAVSGRRIAEDRGILDALAVAARGELAWTLLPDGLALAFDRWQAFPRALRRRVFTDALRTVTKPLAVAPDALDQLTSRAARLEEGGTLFAGQLKLQRSHGTLKITCAEGSRD